MSNYSKRKLEEAKQKKQQRISMLITCMVILAIISGVVAIVWKMQQIKAAPKTQKEVVYDPSKYVSLGKFEGKEVYKVKAEVTEESVQNSIDELLKKGVKYSEVEDRGIESGDQITIDFVGKIDEKEFSGGSAKDYLYKCGQGSMIEGFDEGLIGAKNEEVKILELKFPDNYSTPEVAGKDVVFTVTIKKIETISEQAEWNDAYVKIVSEDKYQTVEEYEKQIRKDLLEQAENTSETMLKNQLWKTVTDTATIDGHPKELYKKIDAQMGEQLTQSASQFGLERDAYVKMIYGKTYEEYIIEYINSEMIAKAIVKEFKLDVTDSEYDKLVKEILPEFGMDSVKKLEETYGKVEIEKYLVNIKLFDYLESKSIVKEVTQAEYEEIQQKENNPKK